MKRYTKGLSSGIYAGRITEGLENAGIPEVEIKRVMATFKRLAGEKLEEEDNPFDIGWMKAKVESKGQYLLALKAALAANIIEYLSEVQTSIALDRNETRGILLEYIIHEVLENTELVHYDIVKLTTDVFNRNNVTITETPEGKVTGVDTPLGRALRGFIEILAEPLSIEGLERMEEVEEREEKTAGRDVRDSISFPAIGDTMMPMTEETASKFISSLDAEEERLVAAIVLKLEGEAIEIFNKAVDILMGAPDISELSPEVIIRYLNDLMNDDEAFRNWRYALAFELRVLDQAAHDKYFGESPDSVINRLRAIKIIDPLMGNIAKGLDKSEERTPETRIAELEHWRDWVLNDPSRSFAAIPDIHGTYDGLKRLINDLEEKNIDRLVFLGDYFDRGSQNVKTFEYLKKIQKDKNSVFLWGNHDIMFHHAMWGDRDALKFWVLNGGNSFLEELGLPHKGGDVSFAQLDLILNDPRLQEIHAWMLDTFKLYHIDENGILFFHAGIGVDTDGNIMYEYTDSFGEVYRGLAALEKTQSDLKNDPYSENILDHLNSMDSPLWARGFNWDMPLNTFNITDKILDELNVNAIVFAHTPRKNVVNTDNKIFGTDMALTETLLCGEGGDLVFDQNGIIPAMIQGAKIENDKTNGVSKSALLALIEESITRLSKPVATEDLSGSAIGKIRDKNGNIIEKGLLADEIKINERNFLKIKTANDDNIVEMPLAEIGGRPKTISRDKFLSIIEPELNKGLDAPAPYTNMLRQFKDVLKNTDIQEVVLIEHSDENPDIKGLFANNKLYINKYLYENPLALIHEIGEGYADLPADIKYEALTRHTFMRGAGKDIRNAFNELVDEKKVDPRLKVPVEQLIGLLETKLNEMEINGKISVDRVGQREKGLQAGLITKSELALLILNVDAGLLAGQLLFGLQDFLDPAGNLAFTQEIKLLTEDLRRGTLNIFLIPSGSLESRQYQEQGGRGAARKFRKMGNNTVLFHFNETETLDAQLQRAVEIAQKEENKELIPKIYVNTFTAAQIMAINDFIVQQPEADKTLLRRMIIIGRDSLPKGVSASQAAIDDVRIITVGSAIMNDNRLSVDFALPPERLFENRNNMINTFINSGIIRREDIGQFTAEGLDSVMKKLYVGGITMRITPVNWENMRAYHDSMQEVLRSL